jgi:hypothetical protein
MRHAWMIAGSICLATSAMAATSAPVVQAPAPPSATAPTAVPAPPAVGAASPAVSDVFKGTPAAKPAPETSPGFISGELRDGTRIEFRSGGAVWFINADGSKVEAPDGVHTLKDGVTFEVKDGKRTNE